MRQMLVLMIDQSPVVTNQDIALCEKKEML